MRHGKDGSFRPLVSRRPRSHLANGCSPPFALLYNLQDKILEVIEKSDGGRAAISDKVRSELRKLFYDETKRRPMIMPVIMEV